MRAPSVTIVHTSSLAVESLGVLFEELGPDVELRHEIGDGLLDEVIAAGEVTPALRKRVLDRFRAAADSGCDVIFSQCSSVGDVADEAAELFGREVVRIDAPMAEEACRFGPSIGVLASLASTLEPTRRLVEATALRLGCTIELVPRVVEGAFECLRSGDRVAHDDLIFASAMELIAEVDCLVLAQGTMAAIVPRLGGVKIPVLTSPRGGVARAIERARQAARR